MKSFRVRGSVAITTIVAIDLRFNRKSKRRRLPTPGPMTVVFLHEENGLKNRYLVNSTTSINVTTRILTVDDGSGMDVLLFSPSEEIAIVVPQDAHVILTIKDRSDDPKYKDSNVKSLEFDATHRDPVESEQLPDPGDLSVTFTGEVEG